MALTDHGDSKWACYDQHLTVLLGDVNAMSQRLDALEHMLGREHGARDKA